ncbi:MAG: manganese-binding transcriptional regulator MntR [Candidatus Dormibacteria bacterium]
MPVDFKPAVQDYLKAIHAVLESQQGEPARTKSIADQLGVSPPSVSAMLDRMAAEGLANYVHYAGATLTPKGHAAALSVIRRHRLLELYLHRVLGLGWDEVHAEAEVLEHSLSARVEAAMDAALGHPAVDPHGDPIPRVDGSLPRPASRPLWGCGSTVPVRVARVSDSDPELLRHLEKLGILPGALLSELRKESGGVLRLRVGNRRQAIGRDAAEKVFVLDE